MAEIISQLQNRIRELELSLASKEAELQIIRSRLNDANSRLENVIGQVSSELQIATQIQKKLSPVDLPNIPGFAFSSKFNPGMKSGGDYFDIFEHDDKMKFGIVIASCSGYAMSALLLTVLIKISSQIEARKGLTSDQMVNLLGKEMLTQMKEKDRVSLFYAVVDRRDYSFSYSSVGNMKAYYQTPGNEAVTELAVSGPEISLANGVKAQQDVISLKSKERLVVCSQGVFEVKDTSGQIWGAAGIKQAIKEAPRSGVHELRNEILIQSGRASGNLDPDRDQTVLVMEVKDRVIKLAES